MEESAHVLYYGPDATATEHRWETEDRPFTLSGYGDDAAVVDQVDDGEVDALVCAAGDVIPFVEDVREVSIHLPVIVFGDDDTDFDAAASLDSGVSHYVDVAGEDRVELLEALESVVSRYRRERRERTMLDSLLDNIPLSVYFKDRQSRHVKVSEDMTTLMGQPFIESPEGRRFHTPADVVGTTDFDLYPSELAESAVEDDEHIIEYEEPVENRIEHAFGSPFDGTFVTTSKAPWYDENGDVVGTVGITRDISERKQYENQLERQNERLERFAQVISHDLRNPLEVAHGRLQFAREDGDAEHFDAIERSLARMDELIDDVLAIARQGEAVSDPEPVDLGTAVRDAWVVVDSGDATLRIETEVTVRADAGRLSQLFENLFRNAVKHGSTSPGPSSTHDDSIERNSPAGRSQSQAEEPGDAESAELTITVGDLPLRSGFYVADDGVGIPGEDHESVFDAGYSTGDDGTGLGLNIVKSIADAHGWDIEVTESRDGGARFEFNDVWGSSE